MTPEAAADRTTLIGGSRAVTYLSVSVHSASRLGDWKGEALRRTRTLEGLGKPPELLLCADVDLEAVCPMWASPPPDTS
jgi:hypothetical protein